MTIYSDPLHWSDSSLIFYHVSLDLTTEFDFYIIARGFHRTFCNGCGMSTDDSSSSGHLVLSLLGLAFWVTCWDQRHPISIRHCTSLWHNYRTEHYYWIWHFTIYWFPWSICDRCGMPTGYAYSSGHLVLSLFGTCMCSNVKTNLSWTCLISRPLSFKHPSVLLFCFVWGCTPRHSTQIIILIRFCTRTRCYMPFTLVFCFIPYFMNFKLQYKRVTYCIYCLYYYDIRQCIVILKCDYASNL